MRRRRKDENRMVWAHQWRSSSVDFTNATVVGPIRKSNRSNCRRMLCAGQRHPSHQPTDHSKAFSWRIADTNCWPMFSENGEGRRWGLVEWWKWKCVNRHVADEAYPVWCDGLCIIIISHLNFFRDHLHFFVGQSLPSSSITVCFQSCQLSVRILLISSRLLSIHLRLGRPLLLFPGTTMSIIFLDTLSSSLLLICPYKFNRFCLRNVDIWHTLASSCMIWFLTCSFLVLPLIHRSILISATCNLFSSFFLIIMALLLLDS